MLALALVTLLTAADSPVVSVMYFDNDSKDPELEFMRKGLTDLLITDLVAWEGVRVVERTRLEDVLKELDFQQTKYVDKATAAKLGKVLNSTYLIYGSMMMLTGGKLIVTARLVQASNGEVLLTVKEQDERDKIFELEQRLVNQLVAKIDAKLSANDQARRRAKVPNLSTLVAYGKALDLSDQGKIDEAQAAMRAVVSKSPTFLLGRERQTELLKTFEEYQKKKKDLIAGRILELGKMVEEAMKDESKFDSLTKEQKGRYLGMRMLRGRFLARVMKQHLTNRNEKFRLARKGSEGQALLAMRSWAENQRRFVDEYARAANQHALVSGGVSSPASLEYEPTAAEMQLIQDSRIGTPRIKDFELLTLARFVLQGRVDDGEDFTAAPTLGSVDPKERKAITDAIDLDIKTGIGRSIAGDGRAENQVRWLLEFKAERSISEGDVDAAIGSYQQLLDTYPTSSRSAWVEEQIRRLLKGGGNQLSDLESFQAAIKTCDDMEIRKSHSIMRKRMLKSGLKAIDEYAADLEKACLPATKSTQTAFAQIYARLAHDAATHDDCERYLVYYRKYLELSGSVYDMLAFARNCPWCDISPLKNDVTYLHARLDEDRDFSRMTRRVVSILSHDKAVLSLSASTQGPQAQGEQEESFDLRLERQKDGKYVCTQARWRRSNGKYIEGTCQVSLAKMSPNEKGPGFDEGTFDAFFPKSYEVVPGVMRDIKLSRGEFRVRRE